MANFAKTRPPSAPLTEAVVGFCHAENTIKFGEFAFGRVQDRPISCMNAQIEKGTTSLPSYPFAVLQRDRNAQELGDRSIANSIGSTGAAGPVPSPQYPAERLEK
jgi:hypothetical protein